MLTQEPRTTMSAMWLARWHSWQGSGMAGVNYFFRRIASTDL